MKFFIEQIQSKYIYIGKKLYQNHHKQKCTMANNENNVGNEKVSKEANGSIVEGVTT